jgi:cytochrome c oxidase subunit II
MKVHTYENAFLTVGALVLVACAAALVYATLVLGIHLPGVSGRVHPDEVNTTPPFDRPGVYGRGPDAYEVVMIGQAWAFRPAEVRVPAGVEITFTATTPDVLHGFNVEGTRLNMMLIPGQISSNRYTFDRPGEYLLICHEYCGLGHHTMYGRIVVEPAGTAVPVVADAPAPGMAPDVSSRARDTVSSSSAPASGSNAAHPVSH